MGCLSSTPPPPDEPSPELAKKLDELRNLWTPGSIWTGIIKLNGDEKPWEIHVKRDAKPNRILAKRITNFAQLTFSDAIKVEFDWAIEEILDDRGKHAGYQEIITFDWEDEEYRLFADTMDGILDIKERRIRGLVVENKTRETGTVDFCRVMAQKKYGPDSVVHTVSFEWKENDPRTIRVNAAMDTANKKFEEEICQMKGLTYPQKRSFRKTVIVLESITLDDLQSPSEM